MTKFAAFILALLLTALGIWVFQVVWNNAVVPAVVVTRPIDFLQALLIVLIFLPHILALGAGLILLPAGIYKAYSEGVGSNMIPDVRVRPGPGPTVAPGSQMGSQMVPSYY